MARSLGIISLYFALFCGSCVVITGAVHSYREQRGAMCAK